MTLQAFILRFSSRSRADSRRIRCQALRECEFIRLACAVLRHCGRYSCWFRGWGRSGARLAPLQRPAGSSAKTCLILATVLVGDRASLTAPSPRPNGIDLAITRAENYFCNPATICFPLFFVAGNFFLAEAYRFRLDSPR